MEHLCYMLEGMSSWRVLVLGFRVNGISLFSSIGSILVISQPRAPNMSSRYNLLMLRSKVGIVSGLGFRV